MKPVIFIPEDVVSSNISSDAKILYGIMCSYKALDINIDIYTLPYIKDVDKCLEEIKSISATTKIPEKSAKAIKVKSEDWNDPNIGVLVGTGAKRTYRLDGVNLQSFNALYKAYGVQKGKRDAAWAFYRTIKPMIDESISADEKRNLMNRILSAARKANVENIDTVSRGSTAQFLQGWISAMRWEDY